MEKDPTKNPTSASSSSEPQKQSSRSAPSGKGKPPGKPAGKASAAPLETAKKGSSGEKKTVPKTTDSSSNAEKSGDSTSTDVNARLDKLEKLLQMFVEDRQKGDKSRTSMPPYEHVPPDRGDGGPTQYSAQYSDYHDPLDYEYESDYDGSGEPRSGSSLGQDQDPAPQEQVPSIAAKFAIPSGIGKPLDAHLASNIEYLTTHPLDEKNISDAGDKYVCPDNCSTLDVPRVNNTIWENLKGTTRTKDLKLQRVQRGLVRGLTAFARSVDGSELNETQQEALALLCNAHFELSCLRKDCIRPEINPKFAHLCKATNVLTPSKQLFGDDLSKRVKDMQEEQKAAVGVVKRATGKPYRDRRTFRPYPEHASSSKARYHDAGWQTRTSHRPNVTHTAQRPFLGPGVNRNPWKGKAPHTQSRPPSSDSKGNTSKGRDQSRYYM